MGIALELVCDQICKELGVEHTPVGSDQVGSLYKYCHLFSNERKYDAYICTMQEFSSGTLRLIWRDDDSQYLRTVFDNGGCLTLPSGDAVFDLAAPDCIESISRLVQTLVKNRDKANNSSQNRP